MNIFVADMAARVKNPEVKVATLAGHLLPPFLPVARTRWKAERAPQEQQHESTAARKGSVSDKKGTVLEQEGMPFCAVSPTTRCASNTRRQARHSAENPQRERRAAGL